MTSSIDTLALGIIEKNKEKIKDGVTNGDIERDLLILVTATYESVSNIKENPAIKIGNLMEKHPKIAMSAFLVFLTLSIVTVLITITGVLDTFGLTIIPIQ